MADRDGVQVTTMSRDDVRWALDWAAREGWNPGLDDVSAFFAADPEGFLMARSGDRVVGTISCVLYGPSFAFAGFYIVEPGVRSQGIGHRLADAALSRAGDRILGLDGVVEQQSTYRTLGFTLVHRNIRFGGLPRPHLHPDVVDLSGADIDAVAAFDEACFGAPRRAFLEEWLKRSDGRAVAVRDGRGLHGYGVIRRCVDGFKIGPIFADDAEVAAAILGRLAAHAGPRSTVFLDVPEPNTQALALARSQGLEPVFETARMYRGGDPGLPLERIFGITSFELG